MFILIPTITMFIIMTVGSENSVPLQYWKEAVDPESGEVYFYDEISVGIILFRVIPIYYTLLKAQHNGSAPMSIQWNFCTVWDIYDNAARGHRVHHQNDHGHAHAAVQCGHEHIHSARHHIAQHKDSQLIIINARETA